MTQKVVTNIAGVYQTADFPNNTLKSNWVSGDANATFVLSDELASPDSNITAVTGFGINSLTSTLIKPTYEYFGLNTGTGAILPNSIDKISQYNWGLVRSHDNQRVTWKDIQNQISHASRTGTLCIITVTSHTYVIGETINVVGIVDAGFNGEWVINNISGSNVYYTCEVSGSVAHAVLSGATCYNYTHLDNWVYKNRNRKKIYTVYQTPTYLSARPTDVGPYGSGGWNAEPADFSTLQAFCTKTAQRYIDKGTPIEYWEVSNEPNLDSVKAVPTATGTISTNTITVSSNSNIANGQQVYGTGIGTDARVQNVSGNTITLTVNNSGAVSGVVKFMAAFFSGSVTALSTSVKSVSVGVKSIQPLAKIISPSLTELDGSDTNQLSNKSAGTYFSAMMNASDGSGGLMKDSIDVIGIHFYGTDALLRTRVNSIKTWATNEGLASKPIFDTESGISGAQGVADYYMLFRMMRLAVIPLCMGTSAHCVYQMGDESIWGLSLLSRPALIQTYNQLISEIVTYGITSASVMADGAVAYRCNNKNYFF